MGLQQSSQVLAKLLNFLISFHLAFCNKSLSIKFADISEVIRSKQKPNIGLVEGFLADFKPWSCFFIWMVKVKERNIHFLSCRAKIEMIEAAHFAALVFASFTEKLFLCKFKSPAIEEFFILVRSL